MLNVGLGFECCFYLVSWVCLIVVSFFAVERCGRDGGLEMGGWFSSDGGVKVLGKVWRFLLFLA